MAATAAFRQAAFVLCLALARLAAAQTDATLVGQAQDRTGASLAGVTVVITHIDTGAVRTLVTDETGRVSFTGLRSGNYALRATRNGFRPVVRRDIRLSVGEQASLMVILDVGVDETTTVTAGVPRINLRTGELSYLVDRQTIERVPINGRNYTDLMSLQPGVTPFPFRDNGSVVAHGLAMSVNGQDPRANVYLLDGTLLNDFTNGPAGSAAGTALGMETVREFRVESNAYGAEFGRNVGGQINAITKSGTNEWQSTAFEYLRNDALDARNYFDGDAKPDFRRNQFGGTAGGPIRRDRLFFFAGYEGLKEHLGRTIVTRVPDDDARQGRLPGGVVVPIDAGVLPYLKEFPSANGAALGDGTALFTFPFDQRLDQDFGQARVDATIRSNVAAFIRYTADAADQRLPTDYPQFPRTFASRNQFTTVEYRHVLSESLVQIARVGFSRTRIGQHVEANTSEPLSPFVPGRTLVGSIDIGGLPRFGTQSSADVQLRQDVISVQYDAHHTRGRHLIKLGALAERYVDDEHNPTFSLGIFRFANLQTFLRNTPAQFIGLTPQGDFNRHWEWTLYGVYAQDEFAVRPDLTLTAGLRYEGATLPVDRGGRDINMPDLRAGAPTLGPLYRNPGGTASPRLSAAWNVAGRGRMSVRGGYGLFFNTANQQNLIVTVTNPPFTPRVVIANPTFPVPPFERASGISVRPIQFDIQYPRTHTWNVNIQQTLRSDWMITLGYAGARGTHLWRNSDLNIPTPTQRDDGTFFYPPGTTRPNTGFSAIEVKTSDGDSWYRALIVELRKQWSGGLQLQSSYTWSRSEDTTQNSTFFSDSTTATTSAMPEFIANYNKGRSDFDATHNWTSTFVWSVPHADWARGVAADLMNGWQVSGVIRLRSGSPLTVFLQTNRSRSLWAPSLGPGTGPDRPNLAPGRGPADAVTGSPDQWFDPAAFALPAAGTFGNLGRNVLTGPDFRTVDVALIRQIAANRLGSRARVDLRIEVFNLLNRANFGTPSLIAFSGSADDEAPLASFGQIRTTIGSARQIQLGARLTF